jgi:leucyl aminopeptidase
LFSVVPGPFSAISKGDNVRLQFGGTRPFDSSTDALVVPVGADGDKLAFPDLTGEIVNQVEEISSWAANARFKARAETTLIIPLLGHSTFKTIVLTGIGSMKEFDGDVFSRAIGAAARAARDCGASDLAVVMPPPGWDIAPATVIEVGALGAELGLYRFEKYRGNGSPKVADAEVNSITFLAAGLADGEADRALRRGKAIAAAVKLARNLGNEPAMTLTPEEFANRARAVAEDPNLSAQILGPAELKQIGANAILAVGTGSANGPRLIRLRYEPQGAKRDGKVVGLVGKAITFDTGGYSIKPYEGMLEMKGDMSGGAAVLGAMSALSALECPVPVEATICAAENMISGTAFRPGDVIEGMNGVTMEILSTDAEGRLVLADGLVDTARRGATELIDLATLTGAAVVALGDGATALFASDDDLANRLLEAADASGERMWRMPLFAELEKKIKGDVADIKNTGGRAGGAITAALFLQHFREDLPWAHLDIAGSARQDKPSALGPKGSTGVGVRTLLRYLTS